MFQWILSDLMLATYVFNQMFLLTLYVSLSDPGSMNVLGQSPRDWKKPMHQNAVPTFFHKQNICHHVWEIVRTTLQCIVLQSQGESLES